MTVITVTEEMVEAGCRASFDGFDLGPFDEYTYTWDQKIVDDPAGADVWRQDTRRILEAALSVQEQS